MLPLNRDQTISSSSLIWMAPIECGQLSLSRADLLAHLLQTTAALLTFHFHFKFYLEMWTVKKEKSSKRTRIGSSFPDRCKKPIQKVIVSQSVQEMGLFRGSQSNVRKPFSDTNCVSTSPKRHFTIVKAPLGPLAPGQVTLPGAGTWEEPGMIM